jgi:hypothetical protein
MAVRSTRHQRTDNKKEIDKGVIRIHESFPTAESHNRKLDRLKAAEAFIRIWVPYTFGYHLLHTTLDRSATLP